MSLGDGIDSFLCNFLAFIFVIAMPEPNSNIFTVMVSDSERCPPRSRKLH